MSNCQHTVPCGCGDKGFTTPLPTPCETGTDTCPTPDLCPETFCAGCVVYCGDTIVNLNIKQGDRMDVITQMMTLLFTNPGCMTPPADPSAITALTVTEVGAGYTDGTYANVPMTGGTGSGALVDVTIAGGLITAIAIATSGTGYTDSDALSLDTAIVGVPTTPAILTITVLPCKSILGLHSTAITSTTINLGWLAELAATSYEVQYKLASATAWTLNGVLTPISLPTDIIGGLVPDTDYHIRVNTTCQAGNCVSVTILVRTKQ